MFSLCPRGLHNNDGCTETVSLSAMEGDSIDFNASVTHIPGGDCGFQQTINRVSLKKKGKTIPLLSCSIDQNPCSSGRVSLERGKSTEFEFVITLSSVSVSDNGEYEVVVEVMDPTDGTTKSITKKIELHISPGIHSIAA